MIAIQKADGLYDVATGLLIDGTASVWKSAARAIPNTGHALVGSSVGFNDPVTDLESRFVGPAAGQKLALHSTWHTPGQESSAASSAAADAARGTVPWIRFKLPHSWASMAAGAGDTWAQNLANSLGNAGGPVWVCLHHEPEDEDIRGEMAIEDWTAMQERLAPIFRAQPNIAFTIILMGYHQVAGRNYPLSRLVTPALLPNLDIVGIDPYNVYGRYPEDTNFQDHVGTYFQPLGAWCAANGKGLAVGETGHTDKCQTDYPNWLADTFAGFVANQGVGYSYFSTTGEASATYPWALSDLRLPAFEAILDQSVYPGA